MTAVTVRGWLKTATEGEWGGCSLDLRLFDFGRIQAEIDRSRAAKREAWLRCGAAARQAVAEVESALRSRC